jgi:hypothetical protein
LLVLAPAAHAASPPTQTLNPPPPPYESCKAVGGGTICSGSNSVTYGPVDNGFGCGTGASAFDVFDQGADDINATRWYDSDGNLTRRDIHYDEPNGEWINPLTDATLPYSQRYSQTDVLAIPGDLTSSTETVTGEIIMREKTGAPVIIAVGRQVYNFGQSELYFTAGRNDIVAAFFEGDPAPLARVCAALGA